MGLYAKPVAVDPTIKKGIWEHFEVEEMGTLAAFVKAYQLMGHNTKRVKMVDGQAQNVEAFEPAPFFIVAMSKAKRPWTPLERLMTAIRTFTEQKKRFKIADFDIANNQLHSEKSLYPDTVEQSKAFYDAIINWDERTLDACVKQYGFVCEKFGFKKIKPEQFSPLQMEQRMSDIEMQIRDTARGIGGRREMTPDEPGEEPKSIKTLVLDLMASGPATRPEIVSALVAEDSTLKDGSIQAMISTLLKDEVLVLDKDKGTISLKTT